MKARIKNLFLMMTALTTLCFAACVVDEDEVETGASTTASSSSTSSVTAVTISGSSLIEAASSTTLTATATTIGNPSVSYSWSITKDSEYATLSATSGTSVTLTAHNTTDSAQGIKVQVVATDGTNTCDASFTVTVAAANATVDNEITSVSVSAASSSISAKGSTMLTATPVYTGTLSESDITYTWSITSGTAYASLASSNASTIKLTGTNTDSTDKTVSVTVTASDGTNSVTSEEITITVAAKATTSDDYQTTSTVDSSYSSVLYVDLGSGLVSDDNSTWEEVTTSATKFFDGTVKVKFTEDDSGSSTGLLRINASSFSGVLAVYLSGTSDASLIGGVKIQTNGSDAVNIYLNGVSITSSNYPCLDITKGSAATVILSGTNTFVDGRAYGTGYGEEYSTTSGATYTDDDGNTVSCTVSKSVVNEGSDHKGTLYNKGDLTLSGSGSLNVTQAYKNCIASKDGILTVKGGTFTLKNYTSSSNTGKNGVFGGAGIVVDDGTITFDGKGIISTSDLRKANGFNTDDDDYPSSSIKLNGGKVTVTTYNGKGLHAPYIYINGGTNTFTVTGTTTYAERSSTGTYYDADGVKQTNATIKFAAEGIEGDALVQISGGTNTITATDDGINASNTGGLINATGGYTYVYAMGGDGLDSNGNITVSGGVIVSIALTGSEDALDWGDGSYTGTITGGFVAGLCGNVESPSVSNAGVVIYNASTASVSAGQTIAIGSSTRDIVYAFTIPSGISSYTNLFMASANMTGSSYTVYKACTPSGGSSFNGLYYEMPTLSASGTTSTVSLSNHLYSNGSGMGGGSMGGPGGSGTSQPGGFGGGGRRSGR